MEFTGRLLQRGFWLYVWDIKEDGRRHLYVGRTGDTSSPHASSPFRRIGQHLDFSLHAKGNALGRQLRSAGMSPEACTFEMTAIGPIFAEQETMPEHRPLRNKTAALERALADELKRRGYNVLGTHPKAVKPDGELMKQVNDKLTMLFPEKPSTFTETPRFRPLRLPAGRTASEMILEDRGRV